MTRLNEIYNQKIAPELCQKLGLKNRLAAPRILKVVINTGISKAKSNPGYLKIVEKNLTAISGQKPSFRKAKKAISGFKIRQGEIVGLSATLRGQRMYDFIEKLINIVLPRIRDFRGLNPKGFDPRGNFTLGISEQISFPEVQSELSSSKDQIIHGLEISIVTNAKNPGNGIYLLEALGFPFKKELKEK
jgi:large subunit ribosomal protein L5